MKVPKLPPQQLASRPVAVSRRAGGIATIDTIGAGTLPSLLPHHLLFSPFSPLPPPPSYLPYPPSDTLFGMIKVLDGWPNSEQARQILLRLSTDNSIVQVMKKHNWKVGVLSEVPKKKKKRREEKRREEKRREEKRTEEKKKKKMMRVIIIY